MDSLIANGSDLWVLLCSTRTLSRLFLGVDNPYYASTWSEILQGIWYLLWYIVTTETGPSDDRSTIHTLSLSSTVV